MHELLNGHGAAILEAGENFGGGQLMNYGINSNTSGFSKFIGVKKRVKQKDEKMGNSPNQSPEKKKIEPKPAVPKAQSSG